MQGYTGDVITSKLFSGPTLCVIGDFPCLVYSFFQRHIKLNQRYQSAMCESSHDGPKYATVCPCFSNQSFVKHISRQEIVLISNRNYTYTKVSIKVTIASSFGEHGLRHRVAIESDLLSTHLHCTLL